MGQKAWDDGAESLGRWSRKPGEMEQKAWGTVCFGTSLSEVGKTCPGGGNSCPRYISHLMDKHVAPIKNTCCIYRTRDYS